MANFQVSLGYIPILTAGIEFVWSKYTLFLWGSYLLMHGCIFHNRKKTRHNKSNNETHLD